MRVQIFKIMDDNGSRKAAGAIMPSGECYVEWDETKYPPDQRYEENHVSRFGCIEDLRMKYNVKILNTVDIR